MKYNVHGQTIEWEKWDDLGICPNLDEGIVYARYFHSYASIAVEVANEMTKEDALEGARCMTRRLSEQLKHKTLINLPVFKEGINRSFKFYTKLTEVLS